MLLIVYFFSVVDKLVLMKDFSNYTVNLLAKTIAPSTVPV